VAKFAKILIMIIRALSLVSIVFGVMIWLGTFPQLLPSHIGLGFLIALTLGVLSVIALAKRVFALGLLGLIAAVLLPVVGLRQFPLVLRHLGPIQVSHVIVVFAALGIAESTCQAIRRTSSNRHAAGTSAR
jgi:tetrahydromethanopterin S-methyltransferase subunit E